MRLLTKVTFGVLLAITPIAYANDAKPTHPEETFKQCYDHATTTYDLLTCNKKEYRYYDAALNKNYKKLTGSLTPAEKASLILAQRAWIKFRKLDCDFSGLQAAGGTLQGLVVDQCYVARMKTRLKELDAMIREFGPK